MHPSGVVTSLNWLGYRQECHRCRVAGNTDPIWHVSSRSGEACYELLYAFIYLTTVDCVINN